jgi:hypothetical protein
MRSAPVQNTGEIARGERIAGADRAERAVRRELHVIPLALKSWRL